MLISRLFVATAALFVSASFAETKYHDPAPDVYYPGEITEEMAKKKYPAMLPEVPPREALLKKGQVELEPAKPSHERIGGPPIVTPLTECKAAILFSTDADAKLRGFIMRSLNVIPHGQMADGAQTVDDIFGAKTPEEIVELALPMKGVANSDVRCPESAAEGTGTQ